MHDILTAEIPDADFVPFPILLCIQILDQDAMGLLCGIISLAAVVEQTLDCVGLFHLSVTQENHLRLPDGNLLRFEVILDQFAGLLKSGGFVAGLIEQADWLDGQFGVFDTNALVFVFLKGTAFR